MNAVVEATDLLFFGAASFKIPFLFPKWVVRFTEYIQGAVALFPVRELGSMLNSQVPLTAES